MLLLSKRKQLKLWVLLVFYVLNDILDLAPRMSEEMDLTRSIFEVFISGEKREPRYPKWCPILFDNNYRICRLDRQGKAGRQGIYQLVVLPLLATQSDCAIMLWYTRHSRYMHQTAQSQSFS